MSALPPQAEIDAFVDRQVELLGGPGSRVRTGITYDELQRIAEDTIAFLITERVRREIEAPYRPSARDIGLGKASRVRQD